MLGAVLVVQAMPSALASSFLGAAWETKILPEHREGVSAKINTVNSVYAAYSSVSYSITVNFPDGSWIQLGYLKGWYRVGNGGWAEQKQPAFYVERGFPSASTVNIFGNPLVGSLHTYTIKCLSAGAFTSYTWGAYIDGVQVISDTYPYHSAYSINVQGESQDTTDSSTTHVVFSSLQQYEYEKLKRGYISQWYSWNGYTNAGSSGDWRITPNSNSCEVWLL